MSTFSKKVAAAVLTATTIVSLSGLGSFASVAGAQTMTVEQLQAQIAQLTAALAALQGGSMAVSSSCTFTRDLMVGSRGTDVTCLQNALISGGHLGAGYNTGYFGALTKAAVMKWQMASGVSNTGYFGPLSRARFMAMAPSMPGTPATPGTPAPIVNSSGSLWIAADNTGNVTGSIISGAGQVRVAGYTFTAPSTMGVTVTGLSFTKTGVLSDSLISNLYLADVATGAVIAQFQSLNGGIATFSGLNLNVPAGQSWRGELRADVSTSAASGNTIAFDLTGVMTSGNAPVAGLPVRGNVLTVTTVSNPSIAGLTLTAQAVGSTVNAGTNGVNVGSWTAAVTNSPVDLKSIQVTLVGSANVGDLKNIALRVNGTQVASVPMGANTIVFSMAANPVRLQTGNSNISIYADVTGSPNRSIQFSILRPFDAVAMDSQYHQNITASLSGSSTSITINKGSITVSTASDSPTYDVPVGASGVTLAKFTIYAAGEAVKVKFLDVSLTQRISPVPTEGWVAAATYQDDLSNVRIVADDGRQLGSSITTIVGAGGNNDCTVSSTTVLTCHFGTSSSNINFVIAPNTTQVFSVIADIGSNADINTIAAALVAGSSALEGQVSFQAADSGAATGATRTVNSTPLTVAVDPSLNGPTYINGASDARIAAFVLTASSAQSATIRTITLDRDANSGLDLQNLRVWVGSAQYGYTQQSVAATETGMTFSGDVVVPAGGSTRFDVTADILNSSTAADYASVIDFKNWTANGGISGSSIAFTSEQAGQTVTISTGPTLTVSKHNTSPKAQNLSMDTRNNPLYTMNFANNGVDAVRITRVIVSDTIASGATGKTSFQNFQLVDSTGAAVSGTVQATSVSITTSTIDLALLGSGVVVEKNKTLALTLKADVPDVSSGGAVSNSSHVFKIQAATDITAKAVGSASATVTVSGSAAGGSTTIASNTQKVYRTKFGMAAEVLGTTSSRSRQATDKLANITFNNTGSYTLTLQSVSLKFIGSAVASSTTAFTVSMVRTDGTAFGSATNKTCTPTVGDTCSVTFEPSIEIYANSPDVAQIRVVSTSFANPDTNTESLGLLINAAGDVLWNDGTTANIQLETGVAPFTIADVTYI